MTPEERLRQAIEARTSRVEPSADALPLIEEKLMDARQDDNRNRLLIGLGAAAAAVAVVVGVLALTGDDDEPVVADTTTTTEGSATSEATTTSETTTTVFEGVDPDLPVFPDPTSSQRFDDPVALATAFAHDFVGFREPIVGAFAQGDSRSGEVEVRGYANGAVTVVLVRQLEDDTWFVIGSVTDSIRVSTPETGATISSPQPLVGQAYAFEGTVNVRFYVDGTQEPIAETVVTGRGDGVLGDYSGELEFTDASGATHGVLVLVALSGEDGSATEATVLRVRL
ncbi:MAG: Gmad2 immunoglobulin-like domain-containing protein [Acidimicrobiales bacterium]